MVSSVLISGIYPAILLSRLKPVSVLNGHYRFSRGGTFLRKALVVFQFAASIVLVAGTIAVYRQLVYMNGHPLGIDIDRTIVLKAPVKTPDYGQKMQSFKQALFSIPGVSGVTISGAVPGKEVGAFAANRRFGADKNEEHLYEMLRVDHDYIKNYHLQVIAGRAFDKTRPADSTGVILNESAVKKFGFASSEAAVGKQVWLETKLKSPSLVIGVIKDYHQQSLQQQYTPLVLMMDPALGWVPDNYCSIRFSGNDTGPVIAAINDTWKNYFPESSLDWFLLDDFYNRQYQQDNHFGKMFILFALLAIFVACMGLFGLTAYSTSRRVREIGIRKVLGASVRAILSLLTIDAMKLVVLAGVAALPLAYYFIDLWLQGYAFRVTLTWWQFVLPPALLMLISVSTIGYITFRAAIANPVRSLREE
jgi:putative ABC transport system permease protein